MTQSSRNSVPNILDLFAGAGGFSLGFHWAGFKTSVAIDMNPNAVESLVANYSHLGTMALQRDLSQLTPKALEKELKQKGHNAKFDVIIGGPPCQGWSMVGRGKIRSLSETTGRPCPKNDPRNELYKRFLEYVKHFKPKVAVMENVTGMLSHSGRNIAEMVAETMELAGYAVTWKKINAAEYGAPQYRERLFFVGIRDDLNQEFQFPTTVNSKGQPVFPQVSLREAISDLPKIRHGSKDWVQAYTRDKSEISKFATKMRAGSDPHVLFDHVCRSHNDQDLEAFKLMKQGGWYRDLPARLKRYRDDIFEDKYKKLSWNKPSGCVTAHLSKDCYTHIHPSQTRTISVREAARIQSFPDNYYLAGSMSTKFELIGNAVAPVVAERIATEVMKQVFKPQKKKSKSNLTAIKEAQL